VIYVVWRIQFHYKTAITVLLGEPTPAFPLLQNQDNSFSGTRFTAITRYLSAVGVIRVVYF
jgi:hypothetical protein